MAKVLLIQPHVDIKTGGLVKNVALPINLVHIGTAVEDKHPVRIYDRNLLPEDNQLLECLQEYTPDIIGINSITSGMLLDVIYVGKFIKEKFPKAIIVIGGVHATIEPDSVLREPFVDYIIRGEGEAAFLEFCDTFDKNPKNLKKLKNVNKNPLRPFVNMDDLKLPNYNLVDISKYGLFYVNLSRGCPGSCTFCYSPKMWGIDNHPCIRAYSTEKAIELFKELIEKYHVKVFSIVDDNFMPFRSRALEICKFLKNYKVSFFCLGRADYLDDEILQALKEAGCHTIQVGIESGSQRILDYLNKKITVEKNIEAIQRCKKHKVRLDASCMVGITTETLDELKQTEWLIRTYKPDLVAVKVFNPMPGTPVFDECLEKGFFKKPETLEEWASWAGEFVSVKHNTSNIPDDILMKKTEELWMVGFYKNKFKRFLYWLKEGEFRYILKSAKGLFKIKGDNVLHLPGLGYISFGKKQPKRENN